MSDPLAAYGNEKALWHAGRIDALRKGDTIVPAQIQLIISDLCDMSCGFCSYRMPTGLSNEQFGVMTEKGYTNNPNRKIPKEKAFEILDDAAEWGVKAIQFTGGGEPLVHPDHLAIFQRALDLGLECGLVTNLWHLKDEWRPVLPKFSWIRASVDAGTAETYSRTRRVPISAYAVTLANIRSLAQELRWRGSQCLFGVGYVITPDNWQELTDAVSRLRTTGASYVRLSAMFSTEGEAPYHAIHEKILEQVALAKELATEDFKVVNLYGDRISDLETQAPDYKFCGYQQFNVYVGGNLKVYRCCTTSYTQHGEVGDLSGQRLSDWFQSEQRREAYQTFDARSCSVCQFNIKNRAIDAAVNGVPPMHVNFV